MKIIDERTEKLIKAILTIDDYQECVNFLLDAFTIKEIQDISQRLEVAELLRKKAVYKDIEDKTGASTATISRVNKCLNYGEGGYSSVLDKLFPEDKK